MIRLLFLRDLSLAARRGGGMPGTLSFCLIVFAVFAFSLGPEALRLHAAHILTVTVLLACLLALPGLFERDHDDGTLEQYLLQPVALEWLVAAKLTAFWLGNILPLVLLAPLLGLMAGLETQALWPLVCALLLATPTLTAIGAFGAALTLGVKSGGISQALILLPLYIPPLIFACAAGEGQAPALILWCMLLVATPVSCWLCGGLLRMSYD